MALSPAATAAPASRQSIPLGVQLAYTAFMAVLVPFYWHSYGPTNFLYFCDVALFLALIGVWSGHPLPASMATVGILVPQVVWCVDFVATALGQPLLGMTRYMFDSGIPLFARGLSLFHGWLPFFLLWMVWRQRYDRRALYAWTLLAWLLIAISWLFLPAPPADPANPNIPVNVNYVYGLDDAAAQTWMPQWAWLTCLVLGLPLLIYVPTHLLLDRCFPARR